MVARTCERWVRGLPPARPVRALAIGTLVSALGSGAWYTSWAVFLTQSVGLSPLQVGLGLTAAGVLGLLAATPLGLLADRCGAREVLVALLLIQGASMLAYLAVSGPVAFVLVACCSEIARSGAGGPRNALILGLAEPKDRLAALGSLRAISHVGFAIGALGGALVIGLESRPAYVCLLILNAVSFVAYAALIARIPRLRPSSVAQVAARRGVIHDRPYVALAALMGVLALSWAMLSSGLPLWVSLHTHAPQPISAVIVVINSLTIAALQVRVTRSMSTPRAAARGGLLAGGLLASSCALFALSSGGRGVEVIVLLLGAGAVHVTGELLFVAASWGLSVPLMRPESPGEYQGVFSAGEATALMLAPALTTTLIAGWGTPGWFVLAAIFLLPATTVIPVTRWAIRTRPAAPAQAA